LSKKSRDPLPSGHFIGYLRPLVVIALGRLRMDDVRLAGLATDARINERLVARGLAPMKGPVLTAVLKEALGQSIPSQEALRQWKPDRLTTDRRVRAVLTRYAGAA
jgi:hypothetical protein